MKRPRLILLALAASAFSLWLLSFVNLGPPDPVYGGVALSDHLYTIYTPPRIAGLATDPVVRAKYIADDKKRAASREVLGVRQSLWAQPWEGMLKPDVPLRVGPEAIPLLTNWLAAPPPPAWRVAVSDRISRFANIPQLAADRRLIAWKFLAEYPLTLDDPRLAIFISGLTDTNRVIRVSAIMALRRGIGQMSLDKDETFRALYPLSSLHQSAQPPNENAPRTTYSGYWFAPVADQLRDLLVRLDPARELLPLYTLEMGQIPARVGAAEELAQRPRLPERAVPLLVANLGSSNRSVIERCAVALAGYGPEAAPAVPRLQELLDHPRERVRVAASNSLAAITGASSRARIKPENASGKSP